MQPLVVSYSYYETGKYFFATSQQGSHRYAHAAAAAASVCSCSSAASRTLSDCCLMPQRIRPTGPSAQLASPYFTLEIITGGWCYTHAASLYSGSLVGTPYAYQLFNQWLGAFTFSFLHLCSWSQQSEMKLQVKRHNTCVLSVVQGKVPFRRRSLQGRSGGLPMTYPRQACRLHAGHYHDYKAGSHTQRIQPERVQHTRVSLTSLPTNIRTTEAEGYRSS
jgi:hypothetical protein